MFSLVPVLCRPVLVLWDLSVVECVGAHCPTVLSRCCLVSPGEDTTRHSSLLLLTGTWGISSLRLLWKGAAINILEHAICCLSVHMSVRAIARSVTADASDLQERLALVDAAELLCEVVVPIHTPNWCCVLHLLQLIFLVLAFLGGWIVVAHFNLHFSDN